MKIWIIIILLLTIASTEKGQTQDRNHVFNKITEFVETERNAYNIPGIVVGITNADSIIYLQNFGSGEINDLYLIGSNSKSFTALAILILQKNGLLDINEPVVKYISWFKYHDANLSNNVTVKDLLNHTSGIPRKLGMYEPRHNTEIQKYYSDLLNQVSPQNSDMGNYEYSNLNYQLLGLIIEKISNKKYSDYLKGEILEPLNLNETFATQKESKQYGLKTSYQYLLYFPFLQKSINNNDYTVPSGFIWSTAENMCHYLRALMKSSDSTEKLNIDQNITEQLFKPRTDIGSVYGMGWEIRKWKEYERFKHDGLTQSFSSSMLILPELEIGIIIMSNINNSPSTIEMADGILRILTDKESIRYSKTSFYLRNSLPLFAFWVLIVLFFRVKQWIKLKFPIGINKSILSIIWLVLGVAFGLSWLIYFPIAFKTPLFAIIDYEPNSGYSLIILTIGIIFNSLIGYFNKTRKHFT
jgi:CubicO group peptidase (beta-lactamase class C family)